MWRMPRQAACSRRESGALACAEIRHLHARCVTLRGQAACRMLLFPSADCSALMDMLCIYILRKCYKMEMQMQR